MFRGALIACALPSGLQHPCPAAAIRTEAVTPVPFKYTAGGRRRTSFKWRKALRCGSEILKNAQTRDGGGVDAE
jgi:hypothetical protein